MANIVEQTAVWNRIVVGGDIESLGMPKINGRLDFRGFVAPINVARTTTSTPIATIRETKGNTRLKGALLRGCDFSGAKLSDLILFDSNIEDCVFDGADCGGWRMWGTRVVKSSFVG